MIRPLARGCAARLDAAAGMSRVPPGGVLRQ